MMFPRSSRRKNDMIRPSPIFVVLTLYSLIWSSRKCHISVGRIHPLAVFSYSSVSSSWVDEARRSRGHIHRGQL
jgi:hypothetical protein